MIVDQNLLLAGFQKKRNVPVKYDRDLVRATMKAMERIEEIRAKRERVFARRRLRERHRRRRRDWKISRRWAEGEHLIRKELQDLEMARAEGEVLPMLQDMGDQQVLWERRV